jgi:PAS domain S-box-containing protein
VSATSELGRGTTFRVEIPLGRDHLPPESVEGDAPELNLSARAESFTRAALQWLPDTGPALIPGEATRAKSGKEATPSGARDGYVLLADDNADLRDYVGRLLEGEGYHVELAGDGVAALASARARRPDLVLTDVMMPAMDGFQLLAALRGDPHLADVPVVMLSARAGEDAQVEGLDAGADDYLVKPFSARELVARVSANLEMARTRRRAADQIRASEARLQVEREFLASVLAKAPVGISLVDGDGQVLMLNERAIELLGHRHEATGRADFRDYGAIHPDGRPYEPDEYPSLRAARGERVDNERMIYRRGGAGGRERIVLEVDAVPIRDGEGRPAGAVTVFDDAGARERTEEALRARVERAVVEREAAREELHQLQKLETIGQLTGGVAHDFNNLLTPIVGALDVLASRYASDERAERIISGAQQSAERARVLVSRLLTFGRRQHLEPRPVALGDLVTGLSDLIGRSLSPQIEVTYEIGQDLPAVIVDPNQLELALLNLCVNARDAMPDGGRLSVTVKNADGEANPRLPAGRYVCVSVSDSGCGMDSETLQRAIEPFFTTKEVGRGTGLGLSMVHGLAAQSNGLFHLSSERGTGTTAQIYLPAAEAMIEPKRPSSPISATRARAARILLVDDEELVRMGTAEMLETLGHQVEQAASGSGALRTLRSGAEFDLLIADYMMPGMTGTALIEQARRQRPGLAALLITGYAGSGSDPDDGLPRLGKPFGQAQLEAAIAGVLESSQARASIL